MTNSRSGFTLMEVLSVIAVIAVLAGLLFPVVKSAKDSAEGSKALLQSRQLGMALDLYASEHDKNLLPSVNYGCAEADPCRTWAGVLRPIVKNDEVFVAPGSNGRASFTWAERSWGSIGLNSSTALDLNRGCRTNLDDSSGCVAFNATVKESSLADVSKVALLANTPAGEEGKGYRGLEFSPFNGPVIPGRYANTPPIASDRDAVATSAGIPADLLKPVYARYGSDMNGAGKTPVIFADGHAKAYSAREILSAPAEIVWRLH